MTADTAHIAACRQVFAQLAAFGTGHPGSANSGGLVSRVMSEIDGAVLPTRINFDLGNQGVLTISASGRRVIGVELNPGDGELPVAKTQIRETDDRAEERIAAILEQLASDSVVISVSHIALPDHDIAGPAGISPRDIAPDAPPAPAGALFEFDGFLEKWAARAVACARDGQGWVVSNDAAPDVAQICEAFGSIEPLATQAEPELSQNALVIIGRGSGDDHIVVLMPTQPVATGLLVQVEQLVPLIRAWTMQIPD